MIIGFFFRLMLKPWIFTMNRWTDHERTAIVELYFTNENSIVHVQRAYSQITALLLRRTVVTKDLTKSSG